jgi:glycosyltransferase involved in cell wall biosynthesis
LYVDAWVRFLGARLDLVPMLSAFDIVASPSPQETFGLALLEAVAAGRPIVYVHCPSLNAIGPLRGVVCVSAEEAPLREAVLAAIREPRETPPSDALERYDIRAVVARIDATHLSQCLRQTRELI